MTDYERVVEEEYDKICQKHGASTTWNIVAQKRSEIVKFLGFSFERLESVEKPIVYLEVGSLYGGNLALTCSAIHRVFGSVIAISVGLPFIRQWGGVDIDLPKTFPTLFDVPFEPHFIIGDSRNQETIDKVKGILIEAGKPIDLLFIDGDHSQEGFTADFDNYRALVREGGVIGCHDITEYNHRPHVQVRGVWERLVASKKFETMEFVFEDVVKNTNTHGIGVVINKTIQGAWDQ